MRGKGHNSKILEIQNRITPAYAGKSEIVFLESRLTEGSPPPMRGKGRFLCTEHPPSRITPAYAGKRKVVGTSVQRK